MSKKNKDAPEPETDEARLRRLLESKTNHLPPVFRVERDKPLAEWIANPGTALVATLSGAGWSGFGAIITRLSDAERDDSQGLEILEYIEAASPDVVRSFLVSASIARADRDRAMAQAKEDRDRASKAEALLASALEREQAHNAALFDVEVKLNKAESELANARADAAEQRDLRISYGDEMAEMADNIAETGKALAETRKALAEARKETGNLLNRLAIADSTITALHGIKKRYLADRDKARAALKRARAAIKVLTRE